MPCSHPSSAYSFTPHIHVSRRFCVVTRLHPSRLWIALMLLSRSYRCALHRITNVVNRTLNNYCHVLFSILEFTLSASGRCRRKSDAQLSLGIWLLLLLLAMFMLLVLACRQGHRCTRHATLLSK